MDFIAKQNGPQPPTQDQAILYLDCETNQPTTDVPSSLSVLPNVAWLIATAVTTSKVRIGVNASGLALGTYTGSVDVAIPDAETCEVGKVLRIPVTMAVQKRKLKFQFQ